MKNIMYTDATGIVKEIFIDPDKMNAGKIGLEHPIHPIFEIDYKEITLIDNIDEKL